MHQEDFEEIKIRLIKPLLHIPDNRGKFQLFSDANKTSVSSALYQI